MTDSEGIRNRQVGKVESPSNLSEEHRQVSSTTFEGDDLNSPSDLQSISRQYSDTGVLSGMSLEHTHSADTPSSALRKGHSLSAVPYNSLIRNSLAVIYLSTMWIWMFCLCHPRISFFKYLTNWGWTFECMYFWYMLMMDVYARRLNSWSRLPLGFRAAGETLFDLTFACQIVVVLFFWVVVFPADTERNILWDIQFHGVGLTLMIVDYFYRFMKFSLRNHKYIMAFGASYACMHIFAVRTTGVPIYPGIHFRDLRSFIIFLSGLTTLVLTHKIAYLITHWNRLKTDFKTTTGLSYFFLTRHDSSASIYAVN